MDCSPLGSSVHGIWSGLPFHSSRYPPDPGIKPMSLVSPALQEDSWPLCRLGSPQLNMPHYINVSSRQATLHIRITGTCMQRSGGRVKCVLSSCTEGYKETKNKRLDHGPPEFRMQFQTARWFSAMQVWSAHAGIKATVLSLSALSPDCLHFTKIKSIQIMEGNIKKWPYTLISFIRSRLSNEAHRGAIQWTRNTR